MKSVGNVLVVVLSLLAQTAIGRSSRDVNLFIGTGGYGHLYPGPKWPNGMVSPGPDTGTGSWSYCAGYQHGDTRVRGFSQIHASGMGAAEFMDVLLQPFSGSGEGDPAWGLMDKRTECAEPGYYACELTNHQVRVELTTSQRVAYHRYVFKGNGPRHVLVDLAWGARMWGGVWSDKTRPRVLACSAEVSPDGTWVTGQNKTQAFATKDIAYAVTFSRRPTGWRLLPAKPVDGPGKRYVFDFDLAEGEPLLVKAALSSVDAASAKANLLADPDGFDFDARRADCAAAWDEVFARAVPEGDSRTSRIFSTSLYHAFVEPSLFCDVDGRFRGADGKIRRAEGYTKYTMFSLWDTYRAQCPLFSVLRPELVRDLALSMLNEYDEIGRVAKHQTWGQEVYCMVGDHSIPFIVDSYFKGFLNDVDPNRILKAIDATARQRKGRYRDFDYDKVGYFPINAHGSPCSHTLEHCLDDACVAMLARRLGNAELTAFYERRAQYYRKLFDPVSGCFRARYENGDWRRPFDPLHYDAGGSNRDFDYTESCAFNYAWHLMHDPEGVIELHGGRELCLEDLNRLFLADEGWATRRRDGDCTGLIGEYAQGHEPQHHIPYYYQFLGRGDRTAEVVREICDRYYTDEPRGVCGNDDCGQMSAWHVFSVMGFYPFMPCGGEYVLGAPQLDKVTARIGEKTLTIRAEGISQKAKYVRSVTLNGKAVEGFKLTHDQIAAGGELVFEMTDRKPAEAPVPPRAKAVVENLRAIGRSGRFVYAWSTADYDWLPQAPTTFQEKTDDAPLITFYEFNRVIGQWYGKKFYERNRPLMKAQLKREFREHRTIPFVTWHIENPYSPKDANGRGAWFRKESKGYPSEHADVVREILDGTGGPCGGVTADGSPAEKFPNPRAWYMSLLKSCCDFCKEFVDDAGHRIPVAFRLFHECDIRAFWWGDGMTTPEELIKLHRLTIDYLRRELGEDNVLFCYGTDRTWKEIGQEGVSGILCRYPGDVYIDILGFDDYGFGHGEGAAKKANYQETVRKMRLLSAEAMRRGKSCGIFESSALDTDDFYALLLRAARESGGRFAILTTYNGKWTFPASTAGMADLRRFVGDEDILTAKNRLDLTKPGAAERLFTRRLK